MEKTMTMDNGDNYGGKKTITANINIIEETAKRIFKWKSPTKRYNTIIDRVNGLGSRDWDKLIYQLYKEGY